MKKLKIDSKEARLIIWLISEGFYISLNTVRQDSSFAQKLFDALALQKKAMRNLENSSESSQADELTFSTNIISIIALTLFHNALLMDQPKFWGSHSEEEIGLAIDRFAKQNYRNNSQLINDFKTICAFGALVETFLVIGENLVSNYYYDKKKSNEYLIAPRLNYLVPIKPAEYSDTVLAFFELFFGGYKSSVKQQVQIHKTFNAFCCPFDEEHVLVSENVAQALMTTIRSKEINKKWAALVEGLGMSNYVSLIETSQDSYSREINAVFPIKEHLPTMVTEKETVSIPQSVLDEIKPGYQFVFHQALDCNSSLIELTTIDAIIEQFLDLVLLEDELSTLFKRLEYAHLTTETTLPSFCNVELNDTIYLMPEGVRIGMIEKCEYDKCAQEYKEFIQG